MIASEDACDALAVAICHATRTRFTLLSRDRKGAVGTISK
jgi:Holliday junction resolvasome RuvABC endonuclease subunit